MAEPGSYLSNEIKFSAFEVHPRTKYIEDYTFNKYIFRSGTSHNRVLEIGIGYGRIASTLLKSGTQFLAGFDISEEFIAMTRQKIEGIGVDPSKYKLF